MSSAFLSDVAGPQIYVTTLELIKLWHEKARLAQGHPFKVFDDVFKNALDAIWAATFGSHIGVTKSQVKLLSDLDRLDTPADKEAAVEFATAKNPEAFDSIMTLSDSVAIPINSPIPRLHHKFALSFYPSLVAAGKAKRKLVKERLDDSWSRFSSKDNHENEVKSALDLIVQREAAMADKEGRPAAYDTSAIRDELFGFLVAGHETTSTAVCWGLKFLTSYQNVQQKLRSCLRAEFKRGYEAGENPTVAEIVRSNLPYLDATLAETLRCGGPIPAIPRQATEDTSILGYRIPKGTDVFMLVQGPGYLDKPFPVDESTRSKSSQESHDKNGVWDVTEIGTFQPERWLVPDEKGGFVFDSRAGPAQPFGAGPRGCFGRKLAQLELKILITLVIWNFELQPTPTPLSSNKARDTITRQPQQCYLRLTDAKTERL